MIEDIQKLIGDYQIWLRDKTALRQVNDSIEITTPYLDRHNDYIQIYAQNKQGEYLLTDDGWSLEDLALSGCNIDSPKRQALLRMTLNGFGIRLNNGKLEVITSPDNFSVKKHNLIQAIMAVNDLFFLAAPVVTSLFYEDVTSWLDLSDIRYTPKVTFTGKTGYDHHFDFVIPKSKKYPERIIKAINHPTKEAAQALVFSWFDTKDVRPANSMAYAFLNDSEYGVSSSVTSAILSYDVHPILWSKRAEIREELVY